MNMPPHIRGITSLELIIIAACIGLVAIITVPAMRARHGSQLFPELAAASESRIEAVERAILSDQARFLDDLDAGSLGIPGDVRPTSTQHGAQVRNGTIIMTWKSDSTFLQGMTYQLSLRSLDRPLSWEKSGSCLSMGVC